VDLDAALQDPVALLAGWNGDVEYLLHLGMLYLEGLDQLVHDHELVTGHVQAQVGSHGIAVELADDFSFGHGAFKKRLCGGADQHGQPHRAD
jgi:hypothetical protein